MNEPTQRLVTTLEWMILTLQFQQRADDPAPNEEWGLDPKWSPDMLEAIALYEDLRAGRIVAMVPGPLTVDLGEPSPPTVGPDDETFTGQNFHDGVRRSRPRPRPVRRR